MHITVLLLMCALLGFISGKKKAIIPWAKVAMDPTAWIDEECYPPGFQWADPSKIQVGQVFHLLDHWRQREESGLTPFIWNPSCELLKDVKQRSEHIRSRRNPEPDSDSEEEDLVSQLGMISENDSESDHGNPPSPSPHPSQRVPGSPEPYEAEDTVSHHSCKSALSICELHITYLLPI
jgi:hypothetical protein